MNNKEFDLDKELHNLNHRYQAESTEKPPQFLDKNILQAAHQAVQEDASNVVEVCSATDEKVQLIKRAWYVPMTFVAMLVISLSVILKLVFDPMLTEQMPQMDGQAPSTIINQQDESAVISKARMAETSMAGQAAEPDPRRQMMQAQSARIQSTSVQQQSASRLKRQQLKRSSKQAALSTDSEQKVEEASFGSLAEKEQGLWTGQPAKIASLAVVSKPADADLSVSAERDQRIKALLQLYNSGNLHELRPALLLYRKDYPLKQYTNQLPEKLHELEIKWHSEKQHKTQ